MKEFKYCHEEITAGVEIPVTVCETQKEMVAELIMQKDCFDFAAVRMNAVEEKRIKGYFNLSDGTLDQYAYRGAMDEAISGTDEEMMYIIYKDGSEYWNGADEVKGKFQRYGIKRAIISTPWGYTVFGDFAINDMGDVTIEESEIEEYGVYAGQYDVKEQDEQEVQETVEQTVETIAEGTSEVETTEQAQAEENKDTFEYRNYIISGNERTGIIAIDNHGNFSPKVYKTVEEAKKAVDEDIEYAEKKYAEMEAEQTEVEETAETETAKPETVVQETMEAVEGIMTDKEAYEIIGNRAKELIQNVEVQQKMVEIAKTKSKDEAEKWLYMTAVATLCGCGKSNC